MATDLAKEIIFQSRPRDRPSSLALVIYSRATGRDLWSEHENMRITAPIDDGEHVLRIIFPVPNYNHAIDQNNQISLLERAKLEYNARDNIEGAASCIEGFMSYTDQRDVMMFTLMKTEIWARFHWHGGLWMREGVRNQGKSCRD